MVEHGDNKPRANYTIMLSSFSHKVITCGMS